MQTYAEYAPTSFDTKGLALETQQDWLVVIGRNRDSDHLAESNFDQVLEALGGESDDCEVHRFSHWACGWLEVIIVRPDSDAALAAADIEERLSNYPGIMYQPPPEQNGTRERGSQHERGGYIGEDAP